MKQFISLLIALLLPCLAAATECMTITYEPSPDWLTVGNKTYMSLELEAVTAPRRIAARFYSRKTLIAEVWDNPNNREYNICTDLAGKATTHIIGQAIAYEGGPWMPSTVYSLGGKVAVGGWDLSGASPVIGAYPSTSFWFEVTRAGTSGTTEPVWPTKKSFPLALANTLNAAAAVDNGDGTVNIPITGHLYYEGQSVVIAGSVNYNSTYTLGTQTNGDANNITITAAYVAETFTGTETIQIANSDVIDNGNGTVNIPLPAHGYASGDDVTVFGTINYDGTNTLGTQSNPDYLTITATYVAEQIIGGYAIDKSVDDPDGSGVQFTYTEGEQEVFVSEPTGRVIGRVSNGRLKKSGSKFILRSAP